MPLGRAGRLSRRFFFSFSREGLMLFTLACIGTASAASTGERGHAVIHAELIHSVASTDSVTVHLYDDDDGCREGAVYGVGKPFSTKNYFEIHAILPDTAPRWLCFKIHTTVSSETLRFDGSSAWLVDPLSVDVETLGTPLRPRLAHHDSEFAYSAPRTPPPLPQVYAPSPAMPPSPVSTPPPPHPAPPSACTECIINGALSNPFCGSSPCDVSTLDSVLRLVRWLLFPSTSAYSIGASAEELARECLSTLESPHATLTANDVIAYTRYRLVASRPPNYRCLSSSDD